MLRFRRSRLPQHTRVGEEEEEETTVLPAVSDLLRAVGDVGDWRRRPAAGEARVRVWVVAAERARERAGRLGGDLIGLGDRADGDSEARAASTAAMATRPWPLA